MSVRTGMFPPPNAGPMGGAGFAFPDKICNFISPITFFTFITLIKYFSQLDQNVDLREFLCQK